MMEDTLFDNDLDENLEQVLLEGREEECVDAMTADLMERMGCKEQVVKLCGRVVFFQNNRGDVCLPVDDETLIAELKSAPGIACLEDGDEEVDTPFVFFGNRLYTRRNWLYERNILNRIRKMTESTESAEEKQIKIPTDGAFEMLNRCQQEGVKMICNHRFSLLTGGPGTGKTFTIVRAVKLIQEQGKTLRLGLAAPTGKAAARVKEGMTKAAEELGLTDIPNASTIHSLLKPNYDLVSFKYNRNNHLPLDWLIVDEASMIDLAQMSKLLDALRDDCRLTLVGDENQLASVEPGRVFGDLCHMSGLSICKLEISTRFPPDGEIDTLSKTVNGNEGEKALEMLKKPENELLHYEAISGNTAFQPEKWGSFIETVKNHFADFAQQTTPAKALKKLNECRVLCTLRHGPYGVEQLNGIIRKQLGEKSPIPMMIVKNNHSLGVNNGDVGVVMPNEDTLYLLKEDKTVRSIPLSLLPDREMAFASTIHKAQGSEYKDVIIVIPPTARAQKVNPMLTREILYTAITRTQEHVFLYSDDTSIRTCCKNGTKRQTGLQG